MELAKKENVASVALAEVKVSEDELNVYKAALSHLLNLYDAAELERFLGASKDEIEGMNDDIAEILACLRRADSLKLTSRSTSKLPQARRKLA
jgi:hypothetical protein